jgi:hypothetical protein
MLIHPTVERLRALGLPPWPMPIEPQNASRCQRTQPRGVARAAVDREATSRENKRLARRLREARLRQSAVVEDADFRATAASTVPSSS